MAAQSNTLESSINELPMLPTVLVRLLAADVSSDSFFDEVLRLGNEDPTLAVKLIQLSNSSLSAPRNPIITPEQAVIRIGTRQIANMLLVMSVIKVFVPSSKGQQNLWRHAIETAVIARQIARRDKNYGIDPEAAYLAGLLHDIGRFLLYATNTEALSKIDETNWETMGELAEAERRLLGYDHTQAGLKACQKWGLSLLVSGVVRLHHEYTSVEKRTKDPILLKMLPIVQMADSLSVLMLQHKNLLDLENSILLKVVSEQCIHPQWSNPPLDPKELCTLLPALVHESAAVCKDLGL